MIAIDIPGYKKLALEHLVMDYNGTLAVDGILMPGVKEALTGLAGQLSIHVITADTFGLVNTQMQGVPCAIHVLPPGGQDRGKLDFVRRLGADRTVAIGNGRNDRLMLTEAELGIAVLLEEGASVATWSAAKVVCKNILDALALLTHPLRLTATLRS